MEKEKYQYDLEIIQALRIIKKNFSEQDLDSDTRYIDYFGNTCPRCRTKFKVYGLNVKKVASVSAFLVLEQKKAVIYCVCKKCAKELAKKFQVETDARKTEEYIFSKLPDLTRKNNESLNEEEYNKEMNIIKKIKQGLV